jgi:hypothetical protein
LQEIPSVCSAKWAVTHCRRRTREQETALRLRRLGCLRLSSWTFSASPRILRLRECRYVIALAKESRMTREREAVVHIGKKIEENLDRAVACTTCANRTPDLVEHGA